MLLLLRVFIFIFEVLDKRLCEINFPQRVAFLIGKIEPFGALAAFGELLNF